jgi:excisionase family DNA binding protein
MNKKDAAAYLGISTRALEGHAQKGHVSVRYVKGKTGDVADFNEEELHKFRAQLESQRAPRPFVVSYDSPESHEAEARSLARLSDVAPLAILEHLAATLRDGAAATARATIGEMIMLTLADASALTNLSKGFLVEAIHEGKLKAKKLGRGWKIKRTDLDAYIRKL